MLVSLLRELAAAIAPPGCLSCRRPTARVSERLCPDCTRALPWLRHSCPRCGLPSHRRRPCPATLRRAWAPVAYEGVARNLVAALKFRGALGLAALMAAQLAAHLPVALRGSPTPALVPVPPHAVRRRRRGFDPAAALTGALSARTGLSQAAILRRCDRGPRQVGLSRAQRRRAGRLDVRATAAPPSRVLLVDDVHTTGATLDACARALVGAGCGEVVAVTYARAL
jgi:ComF family protein